MGRKIQTIFIMLIFMLFFVTACESSDETKNSEQEESQTEQSELIEQPVVSLKNLEQGVLVTWNEIPNVDGYYVYAKIKGEKYKKIATIDDSATVEYIDLEARSGTEYYYAVRAYIGEERSGYKAANITTGIWQPEVKVSYAEPAMKITWNLISGVDGYHVYRKEEGGKYSRISTIKNSETISYIDEEISSGKIYTYAVRAYIGEERSAYIGVTCASIAQPLVEVKDTDEGVEISWNEIEGAEGYYIYRKEEGGKFSLHHKIENVSTTVYLDTDLAVGTRYLYAVRAYLGKQRSSYSAVDITTELGRVSVALKSSDSKIELEWNEIAAAEGYYIYRKAEGEEEYSLINTIDNASIVCYVDQQIDAGCTYYYTVRAFLGDEQSSYSGAVISTANN